MTENKQGLLIIDVQNDFFPGGVLPVKEALRVVGPINAMSERFYEANRPVYLSKDFHPPKHKSFVPGGVYPPHCIQGTKGAAVYDKITLDGIVLIDKCYSEDDDNLSCFGDGRLEKILSMSGIRDLFIAGLTTEYSILSSVLDGLSKGLQVYVVEDAIAPENNKKGDKAIATMVKAGAQFISLRTALDRLPTVEVIKDM